MTIDEARDIVERHFHAGILGLEAAIQIVLLERGVSDENGYAIAQLLTSLLKEYP